MKKEKLVDEFTKQREKEADATAQEAVRSLNAAVLREEHPVEWQIRRMARKCKSEILRVTLRGFTDKIVVFSGRT